MSRFVGGDYGWTIQVEIMLAYQKIKYRKTLSLGTQLDKQKELLGNELVGKILDLDIYFNTNPSIKI